MTNLAEAASFCLMSRPLRIEFSGACYHIINRGNYRSPIFAGKGAAEAFERTLGEAAERFGWCVHAYVIMRNHFHLAVETNEPNLSEGMKWLQGTWIRRYNSLRSQSGRPFQGRYKALLVARGHDLAQVCHYIHLNPVRARVVAVGELPEFEWCSLDKFMPKKSRAPWLSPEIVLSEAGGLADTPRGWKSYLDYLEFLVEDEPSRKELVAKRMSRGWCIGDAKFKKEMKALMPASGPTEDRFEGLAPEDALKERMEAWEDKLQALATASKIDLGKLPAPKSHPDKVRLAAALKTRSSVSNGWLAQRLKMGQPASASQFVRRHLLDPKNCRAVRTLLSKVKT